MDALCGSQPTLGMDVHPGFRLSRQRLAETADFLAEFLAQLECIAGSKGRSGCPRILQPARHRLLRWSRTISRIRQARPVRARSKAHPIADGIAMRMPRKPPNGDPIPAPYSPAATLPYSHRWRLFRTPNDAFLTANTHREGTPPVRRPPAGLFRAVQRRHPSHGRSARHCRHSCRAGMCARSWTSPPKSRCDRGQGAVIFCNSIERLPQLRRSAVAPGGICYYICIPRSGALGGGRKLAGHLD